MLRVFSFSRWSLTLLVFISLFIIVGFFSQLQDTYGLPRQIHVPFSQHPLDTSDDRVAQAYVDPHILLDPIDCEEAIKDAHGEAHPIDELVRRADKDLQEVLKKETRGSNEAAQAYRKRRGRHPPPRFDEWVEFAEAHDAIMIEDFFDQIYRDLEPFWAVPGKTMKDAVAAWPHTISVHSGNATLRTTDEQQFRMPLWLNMTAQIADKLPDLDFAINDMDVPRLIVPFENIERLIGVANQRRKKPHPTRKNPVNNEFPAVSVPKWDSDRFDFGFEDNSPPSIWAIANSACHPKSPGAQAEPLTDYSGVPTFPKGDVNGTFHGYVSNWTMTKDPCVHPHLRDLHGNFIEPLVVNTSLTLFPIFGGSKLAVNNDITLPPARYWDDDDEEESSEKRLPWEYKTSKILFLGPASGGRNRESNWKHFHRHRLVRMLNSTHAANLENHAELRRDAIFPWPDTDLYRVRAAEDGLLGQWLHNIASAEFTDFTCFPDKDEEEEGEEEAPKVAVDRCSYLEPYYSLGQKKSLTDTFRYKLIPSLDGNTFSGTYRSLLRSFSLPLKATVYNEWHDDRLWPWKHFVPMDNSFSDLWGILEYFLGYDSGKLAMDRIKEHRPWAEQQKSPSRFAKRHPHPHPQPQPQQQSDDQPHPPADNAPGAAPPSQSPAAPPASPPYDGRQDGQAQEGNPAPVPPAPGSPTPGSSGDGSNTKGRPLARPSKLSPAHDKVGQYLAQAGHNWAQRVLRREDMLIYMYRLLLEYARLASEERDKLGWTGDLEWDAETDAAWGIGTGPPDREVGESKDAEEGDAYAYGKVVKGYGEYGAGAGAGAV